MAGASLAAAISVSREGLRRPTVWVLTLLGALLYHFSHLFNVSAFHAPHILTREMVWSSYWLITVLLAGSLGWQASRMERSVNMLLFQRQKTLQLVLGTLIGAFGVLLFALVLQFVISMAFYLIWRSPSFGLDSALSHAGSLVACVGGGLPIIGWALVAGIWFPRAIGGVVLCAILLGGHTHPALFGPIDSAGLDLSGALQLLFPDFSVFRQSGPLLGHSDLGAAGYLARTGGYGLLQILFTALIASLGLRWRWNDKS